MNLGVVVDFSISDEVRLQRIAPSANPPSISENAVITERLENVGAEPATVRGVAVILDANGNLLGKANFEKKRLLPGESNMLRAEYSGALGPGRYQVFSSLEYAGRIDTKSTELIVP